MTTRLAIYIRVSSEEQVQGFSLDAQEKACRDLARVRDWQVVEVYTDAGFSATTDKRPAFQRMIADAQDKKFDAILIHKFDRFARNRKDAVTYKALLKQLGITVYSVSEPIDSEDPAGMMTEGVLEVMAEWYSANLSRETKKGKRARAEAGYQNNMTPFGYRKEKGKDTVAQPDPATAPGYVLAVQKALEGLSDLRIAWALNEAGYRATTGRLFSKDTVAAMLKSRFYLGEVCHQKKWYPGRHTPLIDEERWSRALVLRRARAVRPDHAPYSARPWPLTTVLYCQQCGYGMRSLTQRGKYRYYRDTGREHGIECDQPSVKAEMLEEQVGEFISSLQLPNDWRKLALEMLGKDTEEVSRIEKTRGKLEGQLKRAKNLYIAGDLSEDEYNQERARIAASLNNLVVPTLPDLSAAAALLANFGTVWKEANLAERKRLVKSLIARVWVRGKNVVEIEPKADAYYLLATSGKNTPLVGSAVRKSFTHQSQSVLVRCLKKQLPCNVRDLRH